MNTSTKVSNNIIAENLSLENLPNEIWKPIKGYEGSYEISSLGRVKSLDRLIKRKSDTKTFVQGRILKQYKTVWGYQSVILHKNNKQKNITIHRLVAINHILNTNDYKNVNHKDGVKSKK